ncbi:PepSY-associated TM helix domain-containing protein [Photobacterium angustum]|uniref:PepSY-associated TM helix domain-containing protein n=1 Tax=Photobacterium angustum TaxID=661 RepID=UPI0005DBF9D7|nr:PepSY domain-containing protein [Photobacterium angustum]KJG00600.1 peptidase [Photobacterium angustum]KJG15812.1 peptidase [Photobacterium angustum]KJG21476.1 peptidase [Photobacterium angustum]KJG29025.1 peptidase [Photobacterium angustum]PSV68650.1 PepSY domain-containing protein [Photobacterium angustum]
MIHAQSIHSWLWRWHIIAGVISLPFIFLLSITGGVYLFKMDYEQKAYSKFTDIPVLSSSLSYQQQYSIAKQAALKNNVPIPNKLVVPSNSNKASKFIAGRFSSESYIFVDRYSGEVTGFYARKDSLMQKVRKLHGELLIGKSGSWITELIASWLVVLIMTGLYLFFPRSISSIKSLFTVRTKCGRRIFYRDLHAVSGFWLSMALLLVLAGGLPWTELFGSNYKSLRDTTGTGYPEGYNGKGLKSIKQQGVNPRTLDDVVLQAQHKKLAGTVTISIPTKPSGIFTISNRAKDIHQQQKIHVDQYSGKTIAEYSWDEVGILSHGRQIVMRIHQGELFGQANWLFMFGISVMTAILSLSALVSYCLRKPKKSLGLPKVAEDKKIGLLLWGAIVLLAVVLPMFGISLLIILAVSLITRVVKKRRKLISETS